MASIGILSGSIRQNGNHAGIKAWVTSILSPLLSAHSLVTLDPYSPPTALGPIVDPVISAGVTDPASYASLETRAWSAQVSAVAALLIITPQYNWGIPGALKNAIDHLYWEWKGKPVVLVTYGGHGGGKCAAQLKDVLEGGLGMQIVGKVEVNLPRDYIRGDKRVKQEDVGVEGERLSTEFLAAYEGEVKQAIESLIQALTPSP